MHKFLSISIISKFIVQSCMRTWEKGWFGSGQVVKFFLVVSPSFVLKNERKTHFCTSEIFQMTFKAKNVIKLFESLGLDE